VSAEVTEEAAPSEHRARLARFARIGAWLVAIALLLFVLDQLGVPVSDWIRQLF
jgi:hypothetical protein